MALSPEDWAGHSLSQHPYHKRYTCLGFLCVIYSGFSSPDILGGSTVSFVDKPRWSGDVTPYPDPGIQGALLSHGAKPNYLGVSRALDLGLGFRDV